MGSLKKHCHIRTLLLLCKRVIDKICRQLVEGLKLLITKEAYNKLIDCPKVPPETGGVLLGFNSIVDTVVFDVGRNRANTSIINYIPNVKFLNECISIFCSQGKDFFGIFHTHACQWDSLSSADIHYIKNIMNAMPTEIEHLYFPIVYPEKCVKPYKVSRYPNMFMIREETIKLI